MSDTITGEPSESTVEERVAAGMEWLLSDDATDRGFLASRVNWAGLDMALSTDCVLGQALGDYPTWHRTMSAVGRIDLWGEGSDERDWYVGHGFVAKSDPDTLRCDYLDYERLEVAWLAEAQRRGLYTP